MAHLFVMEGDIEGTRVPLGKITCFGRGLDMDVRLDDLTVSKRHARIVGTDRGEYILEDLGSSNGTFLNGAPVTTRVLQDGDKIRVGATLFQFREDSSEQSEDPGQTLLDISANGSATSVVSSVDLSAGMEELMEVGEDSTFQQVSQINYRLRKLLDISQTIGRGLDEGELLDRILDSLFDVFPDTHRGFIILRDPETGRLTPAAQKVADEMPGASGRLEISETILDCVLQQKRAILSADTLQDERFASAQSIMDFSMRSVMCAPLMSEGLVLGFILMDAQQVSHTYDQEGLTLLAGIANQAALTIANARLHQQLIRRERLEQDLRNAHRIQSSFLPKAPPVIHGYEFMDWYDAALEVGGDFYDFIELPSGMTVVAIGDVSGKGITAALMMAKMTSTVRFYAGQLDRPGVLLSKLNDSAMQDDNDMFTTCLIMVLDPEQNTLTMANAGHCYPMLVRKDGTALRLEGESGFPIGITEGSEYEEETYALAPGDVVCAFTDGIIEAMNENREQYGYEQLAQALTDGCGNVDDVVSSIQRSIRAHTRTAPQSDDLTLVCVGRRARDAVGLEDAR